MNILEYIKGNEEVLSSENINNIDLLILSEMSYFKYERFFEKYNIPSLHINDLSYTLDNSLLMYSDTNINLARIVVESPRFMNVLITDFVYEVKPAETKQFSGLTYHIGDDLIVPTFRGTDNTATGWKENFEMSYKPVVPAMKSASEYLNCINEKYNLPIIVTGHSKGGLLSVYAASTFNGNADLLKKVYSFDGPGPNFIIKANDGYLNIKEKIFKFNPYDSVFSALYYDTADYKIVKAKNVFLHSHSPYTWDVEDNDFVYLENGSDRSLRVANDINSFLKSTNNNLLEEYTNKLFAVLDLNGIKFISDIKKNPFLMLQLNQVVSTFDPESRRSIMTVIGDIMAINAELAAKAEQ